MSHYFSLLFTFFNRVLYYIRSNTKNILFICEVYHFYMNISFEYYRIFYYVAKYENITKAAMVLKTANPMSQGSSISWKISWTAVCFSENPVG